GEALGVVDQDVAHMVDAANEVYVDPVDDVDRLQVAGIGLPDEAVGGAEVGLRRRRRRKAADRLDEALQLVVQGIEGIVGHRIALSRLAHARGRPARSPESSSAVPYVTVLSLAISLSRPFAAAARIARRRVL